jgi:glycosyltransferase involved in cell wall biosynthesis
MFSDLKRSLCKIMLVTKKLERNPSGGRELLCRLNHDALHALCGNNLVVFELPVDKFLGVSAYINAFRGHIDGLNEDSIEAALKQVHQARITQVFVDGSNLGGFVAVLKQRMPEVEVITFFHNVEARFFWGSLRLLKTVHALGVLVANTLAERKAVKYSNKIVCLSERDSSLLKRLYGRGATHIAPMVLEDKCPAEFLQSEVQAPERFALFVGGTFYANRQGIAWFVREVVPHIDMPLFIVGRGFDAIRSELEISGKVTVVGLVDSLADWYNRAQFVVAPIFDGSGMKTKVAEALMFGKKVIGTPEAFSGYDDVAPKVGWLCETADEFAAAIASASSEIKQSFNPALRAIYEDRFSMKAGREKLASIIFDA